MRSGLTISQVCPSSADRKTWLPEIQSSRGSHARVEDGERPLEAVPVLGGRDAHPVPLGPRADHPLLPGAVVVVDEPAVAGPGADGAAHDDVRDRPASPRCSPLSPPPGCTQSCGGDGAAMRLARQAHRPVVLLRAVDRGTAPGRRRTRGRTARSAGCRSWTTTAPPLNVTHAPPSLPSIIRRGFAGSIQRSWLSPCGVATSPKVLPPSLDFHSA